MDCLRCDRQTTSGLLRNASYDECQAHVPSKYVLNTIITAGGQGGNIRGPLHAVIKPHHLRTVLQCSQRKRVTVLSLQFGKESTPTMIKTDVIWGQQVEFLL
jgi:hypothetical protein